MQWDASGGGMRSQARLEKVLRRIARDLDEIGARFALIGGLAVSARTGPRFTRDADLAVAVPDDRAAEKLLGSLRHHGYEIESLVEHDAVGRMATARLVPPGEIQEGVIVDLLFASSGVEREIVREADDIEILPGAADQGRHDSPPPRHEDPVAG